MDGIPSGRLRCGVDVSHDALDALGIRPVGATICRPRLVAGSGSPAAALALGPGGATALGRGPAAAAWMVPAGIALVVIACFLPTLRNDFVLWDDDLNFTDNPSYRGLSWRQLHWMFTTVHGGHYQPLSWVTLGLDYTLWGMNPTGYHLTSLLLHAVNAVLFYYVVVALLRRAAVSASAGAAEIGRASCRERV